VIDTAVINTAAINLLYFEAQWRETDRQTASWGTVAVLN